MIELPASDLRPVLKSLILSLLPALEEEASEDFERALQILERLERIFSPLFDDDSKGQDKDGYFWQCLFLAVITSPSRRQGALNFLTQKLPCFESQGLSGTDEATNGIAKRLSQGAEVVISPEPGLLIRCFVCGLSDPQLLIQRGYLDLLVTCVPLNSPLLKQRIGRDDLDRLVSAATHVLLRRDMSLNRRLWSWFLGPDPKTASDGKDTAPSTEKKDSVNMQEDQQFDYFSTYGRQPLERCLLSMFQQRTQNASEKARPFRICHSLMDRWEVGGSIVPDIFLPAIESIYRYSLVSATNDTTEVLRSASLFFDGVEARLIWSKLLNLLRESFDPRSTHSNLDMFRWIFQNFNIRDEEMLITHIPYATIYLLAIVNARVSAESKHKNLLALEIASALLDAVPERAFVSTDHKDRQKRSESRPIYDAANTKKVLENFYETSEQGTNDHVPLNGLEASNAIYALVTSLLLETMSEESSDMFAQVVAILLTINTKAGKSEMFRWTDLSKSILRLVNNTVGDGRVLPFSTITAILSLLSVFGPTQQHNVTATSQTGQLLSLLSIQTWQYLSPASPKYHVEAVKAIWQLQELQDAEDCVEASLTNLIRLEESEPSISQGDRVESVRRFAVIWDHTIPAPASSTKRTSRGLNRRGSAMPSISDAKQALRRQKVLMAPLMMILDLLDDSESLCADVVSSWLQGLLTLENVLNIHFDLMGKFPHIAADAEDVQKTTSERLRKDASRQMAYIMAHMNGILSHANDWIWQCLSEMSPPKNSDFSSTSGINILAEYCCEILCNDDFVASNLESQAITLLNTLLSAPTSASLKSLDIDSRLIDRVMAQLFKSGSDLQGPFLNLITRSLRLRTSHDTPRPSIDARPGSSSSLKRSSITVPRPSPNASNTVLAATPPAQLSNFLQLGFSSPMCRGQLNHWILFLSNALPVFADAIFTSLIPLVECLCTELDKAYHELLSLASTNSQPGPVAPEATIMALLDALEMVLGRAHECLAEDRILDAAGKTPAQPRTLLSNVTSGVFRSEGPPSKTAQANSRLTVVLAFQDAIRISSRLWNWASRYSTTEDFDRTSAATTSFNALRVRNRTRHLVEQMFAVEPLEGLEVIISNWWHSADSSQATAALDLLHVLHGLRPKIVVPTVLDAICSRVNPTALPATRQSCLTTDLTALEIALFLSAYLRSTEDDAMDEIWSDCLAFFRDVLSNPLPYRQVLPALLSTILLLAQKVDNTNFGEQRKMRRDLGDVFIRCLSATFTAMPAGAIEMQQSATDTTNPADQRSINLVTVLKQVTANIEVILETSDRWTSAINSISSNFVSLVLHAKTFPTNVTPDFLGLILQMSKKAPSSKSWKKEMADAFNDPRLLTSSAKSMQKDWFPVLHQWCLHDKERFQELMSRLAPPSSAGIMFGVGASAARLEADRKAQLNLRRICLLLLSSPEDTFAFNISGIEEKLVELFEASPSSSPSSAVKAELFMVCRALTLSISALHLSALWPIMNSTLQSALLSLLPNAPEANAFNNLSLLQACKLLDTLVAVSIDEFQLHEWIYITDTIDAVYQPSQWTPTALSDQVADALSSVGTEDVGSPITPTAFPSGAAGRRRPLLDNNSLSNKEDIKVMARDDFARIVLKPFLGQLSMHAYEGVYSMDVADLTVCRFNLLEDVLDLSTIVE